MDHALEMLVNCLKWRKEFNVAGLEEETFPDALEACGMLHGRDKVCYILVQNHERAL